MELQDWKWKLGRQSRPEKTFHFVVGDVHGCYFELLQLEAKAHAAAQAAGAIPFFVLVGDLIDRGPSSREVVHHVMQGVKNGTHYCVAGNHEAIFLELVQFYGMGEFKKYLHQCRYIYPLYNQYALAKQNHFMPVTDFAAWRLQNWVIQGGGQTLESFGLPYDVSLWDTSSYLPELNFLCTLPLAYFSDTVCVTHALASPADFAWALDRDAQCNFDDGDTFSFDFENPEQATALQNETFERLQALLWNREQSSLWPDDLPIHVSGHTPTDGPLWYEKDRRLIVDTGCVFGRDLTAYCPETNSFVSVPGYGSSGA